MEWGRSDLIWVFRKVMHEVFVRKLHALMTASSFDVWRHKCAIELQEYTVDFYFEAPEKAGAAAAAP